MKTRSIWLDGLEEEICPSLKEDIEVDVLIIGGGITGMSTAYHLKNSHLKIAVVEQNRVGHGVTAKTTGKLTYFQDIYPAIEKSRGLHSAKLYLKSQQEAVGIVKEIITKEKIDCDLVLNRGYLYASKDENQWKKVKDLLEKLEIKMKTISKMGAYIEDSYVFHPLKYVVALKRVCLLSNIQIYENTRVISIKKDVNSYICITKQHHIRAKKVVIASHYPFFLVPFWMPLKAYLEKSLIIVKKVGQQKFWNAISIDSPIVSNRFYDDAFFYLSHVHKIKDIDDFGEIKKVKGIEYVWSNKDLMTYDSLPFIGSLNSRQSLFIGTGYNTWGMTNGSLAGKIIAQQVLGKKTEYDSLFNPLRYKSLIHFKKLGSIAYDNMVGYVSYKKQSSCNVRYGKINGKEVAIYVDEQKKEHIVDALCPHMHCKLIFNEMEKTWDCPCHGSRFDIDGNVIEGPSQYDIKIKS